MPPSVILQRKDGSWPGRPNTDLPVHWVPYDAWHDLTKVDKRMPARLVSSYEHTTEPRRVFRYFADESEEGR